MGKGVTYIPAGNSPNLGVIHHLEVIRTGATYIPAGNSPYLSVSHHLEVKGKGLLSTHGALKPVLSTFTGTNFAPWSGEAVIY